MDLNQGYKKPQLQMEDIIEGAAELAKANKNNE